METLVKYRHSGEVTLISLEESEAWDQGFQGSEGAWQLSVCIGGHMYG
jgi:hypothetical protein